MSGAHDWEYIMGWECILGYDGGVVLEGITPGQVERMSNRELVNRGLTVREVRAVRETFRLARVWFHETALVDPILDAPEKVAAYFRPYFVGQPVEQFYVVTLTSKIRVIQTKMISQGSVNHAVVHAREILNPAIRDHARSIIVSHNHPSGECTPSRNDVDLTNRLKQACDLMGIQLLDHVIVGEKWFSFNREGLL